MERKGATGLIYEYEAQFVSFSPGVLEPAALPGLPPAEAGAIIAPKGMEWPEEAMGESTRKWEPKKAPPSSKTVPKSMARSTKPRLPERERGPRALQPERRAP